MTTHTESEPNLKRLWPLCLASLGIVYGDIGTSPLYAFRECFAGHDHGLLLNEVSVMGLLSLIFWALIAIVSIKYMIFVLRADNAGEGGVLALGELCLAEPNHRRWLRRTLVTFAIFGSALLYGDGVITPAISVLSALEGLKVATPIFENYIVPLTVVILVLLFSIQSRGTAKIGKVLGPIMMVWFSFLAILGVKGILLNPSILKAISPYYAYAFFAQFKSAAFISLGAVFLVVTGGEALYADIGHFGKKPIRLTWFYFALPALLLNYFGQGALLIQNPASISNPFFELVPRVLLYPSIALATCATVIASQAVISGVFSLTTQAVQQGYCPRFQIVHTSSQEIGQVYLPQINRIMCVSAVLLVLSFKSSSALAAAYGIAVSLTMVLTTLLLLYLAHAKWKWSVKKLFFLGSVFLVIDLLFFGSNMLKFFNGGWVPLTAAAIIYTLMTIWIEGRRLLVILIKKNLISSERLTEVLAKYEAVSVPGTAVFLAGSPDIVPPALVHNIRTNKVIHQKNIFLTVKTTILAQVKPSEQIVVAEETTYFSRVIITIGFLEEPNVPAMIARIQDRLDLGPMDRIAYFIGRETLIPTKNFGLVFWRAYLFSLMARNAQSATQYFEIPPDQVIEVGMQLKI